MAVIESTEKGNESNKLGGGWVSETLAEGIDNLCGALVKLNERWDNRLKPVEMFNVHAYFKGRFAIISEFSFSASDSERYLVVAYCRPSANNFTPIIGFDDRVLSKLGDHGGRNKHVVFLPVTEFIQGDKHLVSPTLEVAMCFYDISKESADICCGLAFESFSRNRYKAFNIIGNGDGMLSIRFIVDRAMQPHPAKIGTCPQVMADVTNEARNLKGDGYISDLKKAALFFRAKLEGDVISIRVNEPFLGNIKLVDQYAGPINL